VLEWNKNTIKNAVDILLQNSKKVDLQISIGITRAGGTHQNGVPEPI
jgi:hypothetical protein